MLGVTTGTPGVSTEMAGVVIEMAGGSTGNLQISGNILHF